MILYKIALYKYSSFHFLPVSGKKFNVGGTVDVERYLHDQQTKMRQSSILIGTVAFSG